MVHPVCMSEPAQPQRSVRIGDAERDQAVEILRDHMAEGRLEYQEFTDRVDQVLAARTQAELDLPFVDLPGRRPGQSLAVRQDAPSRQPVDLRGYRAPWWTHWSLLFVAIALSAVSRGELGPLVPLALVWVWWIGPNVARRQFETEQRRRQRRELP